jgi:hypothetical protein
MADLLTHLATVYVPTRLGVRDPAVRSLVYLGVCLPDLLSRAGMGIRVAGDLTMHDVIHTPAVQLLGALALSQLFVRGLRGPAFGALLFGGLMHLLVDAGKATLGTSGVMWGFPGSLRTGEWDLYLPEDAVYLMAPALLLIVLARRLGRALDAQQKIQDVLL